MSKQSKKGVVPPLRFPEFRDAGAWEWKPLGKVFQRITNKNKVNNNNVLTISAQLGLVSQLVYFNKKVSSRDLSSYYHLSKGDFAYNKSYSKGYPVGVVKVLKNYEHGVVSPLYICFKSREGRSLLFFEHYFESSLFCYEVGKIAQEGGRNHGLLNISVKEFFDEVLLCIPQGGEQQKIAECLSSLDELIAAHTKKHEALQSYKKGLLQKLFPTAGESVPELRFSEFVDDGDWVVESLQGVASYENGKAHEQEICDDGNFVVVNSKFISTEGAVRKYSKVAHCLAGQGDILMVLSDVPNGKAIGKCFVVDTENFYSVNQRICKLTPHGLDSRILYYILNRNSYFLAFDDDVNQTNLKKNDVLNCPIRIPKCPKEQQKVADLLCSVDELIQAQAQKIEALKAHKKGLMQQLFPRTDEVDA